jgi:hypothetical protein
MELHLNKKRLCNNAIEVQEKKKEVLSKGK